MGLPATSVIALEVMSKIVLFREVANLVSALIELRSNGTSMSRTIEEKFLIGVAELRASEPSGGITVSLSMTNVSLMNRMPDGLRVRRLTVSVNIRVRIPVFKSNSNLSSSGRRASPL